MERALPSPGLVLLGSLIGRSGGGLRRVIDTSRKEHNRHRQPWNDVPARGQKAALGSRGGEREVIAARCRLPQRHDVLKGKHHAIFLALLSTRSVVHRTHQVPHLRNDKKIGGQKDGNRTIHSEGNVTTKEEGASLPLSFCTRRIQSGTASWRWSAASPPATAPPGAVQACWTPQTGTRFPRY